MKAAFLCAAALTLVAGCGEKAKVDGSGKRVSGQVLTEEEIFGREARVTVLEKRVEALEKAAVARQDPLGLSSFVTLSADAKGYQVVHLSTGALLVRFDDLAPYLDGYKIQLSIGNPQSVAYAGCKLELLWAGRTKADDLTDELRAGYWTPVEVIVTPASVEEIKSLQVAVETSAVRMLEIRKKQ